MPAKPKSERMKTPRKLTAEAREKAVREWPAHWPRFTTPEYYAWKMAHMPDNAIVADWSKHRPHHSYAPIFWYEDRKGTCVQCGVPFVFTKEAQQKWYEVYQIPIYAHANRCHQCRAERRHARAQQREHMVEMALRAPHPHASFFKRSA